MVRNVARKEIIVFNPSIKTQLYPLPPLAYGGIWP
jgi:hypothetical protein